MKISLVLAVSAIFVGFVSGAPLHDLTQTPAILRRANLTNGSNTTNTTSSANATNATITCTKFKSGTLILNDNFSSNSSSNKTYSRLGFFGLRNSAGKQILSTSTLPTRNQTFEFWQCISNATGSKAQPIDSGNGTVRYGILRSTRTPSCVTAANIDKNSTTFLARTCSFNDSVQDQRLQAWSLYTPKDVNATESFLTKLIVGGGSKGYDYALVSEGSKLNGRQRVRATSPKVNATLNGLALLY